MSTAAETQTTATPTTTTPTPSGGGGGSGRSSGGAQRRSLRGMSYEEGASALNPVQMRESEPAATQGTPTTANPTSGGTGTTAATTAGGTGTTATTTAGGTGTTAATTAGGTGTTAATTAGGTGTTAATGDGSGPLVNVPPGAPQPVYNDPTRDPTFRQNTLRWAQGRIERIRELMSYGVFDWAITDSEAMQALGVLAAIPTANRMVVMQELARTEAGGRLFENLPAAGKTGANKPVYLSLAVVTNHAEVMRQAVTEAPYVDATADAPMLVRGMTMIGEADIRAEAAKVHDRAQSAQNHLSQWIAISPNPPKESLTQRFSAAVDTALQDQAAQTARTTATAQTTAATDERMRTDPAFRQTISTVQGLLSYGVFDWAITDREARQVFGILKGLSASDIRLAVNQLDRGPFMDRFLDNLPTADRYGADKQKFLEIISARTPEHNQRFVRELLSYGVFDWAITSEEARLAFAIVKTMPADIQRAFQDEQNGQWWHRMEGHIAQEQANDRDMNLYRNEGQVGERKAEFEQNCATWDRGRLQTNIEMLCRMSQDQWVETTLRQKGVLAVQANAWIGQTYGFMADRRDQAIYDAWITNRAGDRNAPGFFQQAGAVASTLGSVLGGAINHGITGADVCIDLNTANTAAGGSMGGAVMGARQNENDNRIAVGGEWLKGHVTLRGQQLNIASYSGVSEGTTTQTGPIAVSGVDVDFKWPTERDPTSFLKINVPLIMARDIAIMSRDSMWTVGAFSLTGLHIEARTPPGTAPQSQSEGITFVMGEVHRTINKLFAMVRGANPQPDQIAGQLTNSFSELGASVRLDSITAERVGGSDGTYVERAEVRNAAITVENSRKGPTIRARLTELTTAASTRALTADETREKETLERNLVLVTQLEEEERTLAAKEAARTIQPAERDRLAQVRSELTITRATVTVAELNVRNVNSAGVHADDAHMGNLRISADGQQRTGAGAQSDAHAEVSVGEMSAHGVTRGDTRVGDVSGSDIHASVSTNAQGTNANLHVGAVDVTGAQQGTQGGGDMHMRNLDIGVSGGANLLTAGADLAGQEIGLTLRLGNLALNNLHFNGSGMTVEAPTAALNEFAVGARVRVDRTPAGAYTVTPLRLDNFDVGRLAAGNLHMVMPVAGEQADIRIPQASVVGLHISNVPLENFNPMNLAGNISVESIQTQMTAQIGPHFQAHGSMSVSDLSASAVEAGPVRLHLGDLSFENLGFTADDHIPPDSPLAKLRGMGGQITRLGGIRGDATVDRASGAVTFTAGVGDFDMPSVHYAGGGHNLSIDGGVRMTGATITGTAQVDPGMLAGRADAPPPRIVITELRVPRISGSGIHYQGAAGRADLQRGYLEDIRVRNLDLATQSGDFHLGRAGVENLSLSMTQALEGAGGQRVIRANASAHISGVDVSRANNGRTTFSVASADANVTGSVSGGGIDASGGLNARVGGVRGTLGANGDVSANVGSANVDANVRGQGMGMSGSVNAHLDTHNASVSRNSSGTHVGLGSANARVSGTVAGAGGSGNFNLDMRNLGANVDITDRGFAATVTLGSIGLSNTRFQAGDKMISMGRGAQLSGVNVRVQATTTPTGIGSLQIENISFTRLSADQLELAAGRMGMTLNHAHIDGVALTGVNVTSTGAVTSGHLAVGQINASAIQAQIGTTLEGHAGGFTANGLSLDMLGDDQFSFRLADVEAHAIGASGGGTGGAGQADLEWLQLHGISLDTRTSGSALNVESASFGVSASGSGSDGGHVGGGTTPAVAADGVRKRYDLPFLSHLNGQVGLDVPIGSDRVSGALVVTDGHARIGPTLESIHLPGEQYWGWAPKWLVARMITETAGYIVDYFNPKFTEIRHQVEAMLASDGRTGTPASSSSGIDLNAQTLSTQLVDSMGRYSTLLDVAAPTGPGILRTARREVGTWATEHNPFNPNAEADAQARRQQDRDRHVQEIIDWVRMIALNIDLTGNGGFTAFKTPPGGSEQAWITAMAQAGLAAHGTLATQMRLGMHVALNNLNVEVGAMSIHANTAGVDASLGASATSGRTGPGGAPVVASGRAGVTGSATGITVRIR